MGEQGRLVETLDMARWVLGNAEFREEAVIRRVMVYVGVEFWLAMTGLDNIFHAIWDVFSGPDNNETMFDDTFYRFCQWSNLGYFGYAEKHGLEKLMGIERPDCG